MAECFHLLLQLFDQSLLFLIGVGRTWDGHQPQGSDKVRIYVDVYILVIGFEFLFAIFFKEIAHPGFINNFARQRVAFSASAEETILKFRKQLQRIRLADSEAEMLQRDAAKCRGNVVYFVREIPTASAARWHHKSYEFFYDVFLCLCKSCFHGNDIGVY